MCLGALRGHKLELQVIGGHHVGVENCSGPPEQQMLRASRVLVALQAYASLPRLTPLAGRSDCLLALVLAVQNIKVPF